MEEKKRALLRRTRHRTLHSSLQSIRWKEARANQSKGKSNKNDFNNPLEVFIVERADSAASQVSLNTRGIHYAHSNSHLPFYIKELLRISFYQAQFLYGSLSTTTMCVLIRGQTGFGSISCVALKAASYPV